MHCRVESRGGEKRRETDKSRGHHRDSVLELLHVALKLLVLVETHSGPMSIQLVDLRNPRPPSRSARNT